ncbi:MAG TPA: tetraacyldisaccharide 4'-kinase [Lacipirellulaceae bacterium]|nr:tetraacyldisaccharide 4'-kinase [Lacipirellulaceae bacterium]
MLRPSEFRDLVSGQRKGIAAACLRGVLRAAEVPYTLAMTARNRRYDRADSVHRISAPVISVGNLTLGGTGKTPMVKWLTQRAQSYGIRVAIVSRGYGVENGKPNDEAMELAASLPNVPHIQNRDRVAAATQAIQDYQSQLLVLDDGFQHRRLGRDLDIVLLDALEPFGFEHVFPRGTLREPISDLRRANIVCLSRADAISLVQREAIRKRVAALAPQAAWCEAAHVACRLVNSNGESLPLEKLAESRVAAFCGIGNPAGFRHTLAAAHCEPVAWHEFPDHHSYTSADRSVLIALAQKSNAKMLVCTQKDLVKLRSDILDRIPLWAIAIEMEFLCGQQVMEQSLENILRRVTRVGSRSGCA